MSLAMSRDPPNIASDIATPESAPPGDVPNIAGDVAGGLGDVASDVIEVDDAVEEVTVLRHEPTVLVGINADASGDDIELQRRRHRIAGQI